MLTKIERTLLAAVIKETYKIQENAHPDDKSKFFPVDVKALGVLPNRIDELYRTIESLDAKGYVMRLDIDHLPKACMLTFQGEHYKEMSKLELIDFLKRSLLIPIVVALLTSLITTGIGYVWTISGNSAPQNRSAPSIAPTIEATN